MGDCEPPPRVFVPSVCTIGNKNVFKDRTSRAARKALKSPNLFSGQAQSTRIRTLKNCITQVNTSLDAFNEVVQNTVNVDISFNQQYAVVEYLKTQLALEFDQYGFLPERQTQQLNAFDLSRNLYTLVQSESNTVVIAKYTNGDLTQKTTGAITPLPADTLVAANLFWFNGQIVFVGIFNTAISTYINIYTGLDVTLVQTITVATNRLYTGQSTCNDSSIYIALSTTSGSGYQTSPIYVVSPTWTVATTNMQANYSTIQQTVGDSLGGAIVSACSSLGLYITYFSNGILYWRQQLSSTIGPCAVAVANNAVLEASGLNNYIFVLYKNGNALTSRLITYSALGHTDTITNPSVTIEWPNAVPYTIVNMAMAVSYDEQRPRFFYTMFLYNPTVTNYNYYVQNGEIDVYGNIITYFNVQVGFPINTILNTFSTSDLQLASTNGVDISLYKTATFSIPSTRIDTRVVFETKCYTYIVIPGCDCPTLPVNNKEVSDSFTHTLNLAICQPIKFTNPVASPGCAPVYTEPTQYLTEAEGAEPPQGPAVTTVSRRYTRINGIDEICKPIPKRYASSRTALIRAQIEAASDTRYAATVLPVVEYPFPCPVYGNQSGIPKASLCQPTIDGRPTGSV
jgi:hypothetical protein